ncbi:hypothetical protein BDY21DRAFT_374315 [Lineolata rhizophorae]|uniref:Uncharacterized protein n=1 Tax=Lineolata rhizophorae TaxID=578093 RepID=A0A6A6NRL9_9PEZI|nr:hypothetical protein BDY21DRAFT_374315 [Lineolata rhizophorae]
MFSFLSPICGCIWLYVTGVLTCVAFALGYDWQPAAARSSPLISSTSSNRPHSTAATASMRASSSPDTTSPVFPDRPIRPLPKRRLHSRLSPEEAATIEYPRIASTGGPLFSFPYSSFDSLRASAPPTASAAGDTQARADPHYGRYLDNDESDEDGAGAPGHGGAVDVATARAEYASYDRAKAGRAGRGGAGPGGTSITPGSSGGLLSRGQVHHPSQLVMQPPQPDSAASSADGYESFENTNNKKKRKIPVSGGGTHHHSTLSAELASMGISQSMAQAGAAATQEEVASAILQDALEDSSAGVGQYYGSGTSAMPSSGSGTGISGAGRGASTNGLNAYATGGSRSRRDWTGSTSTNGKGAQPQPGIIGAAIASAAADPSAPITPSANTTATSRAFANENASNLPAGQSTQSASESSSKPAPQKTQFTFTCESDSANKMVWPGQSGSGPFGVSQPGCTVNSQGRRVATQGTQTGAGLVGQGGIAPPLQAPAQAQQTVGSAGVQIQSSASQIQQTQQSVAGMAGAGGTTGAAPNATNAQAPKKRRPRRSMARELELAARQRRLQQEYNNFHHPPRREDIWICEFCEYESIFGAPPEALVRQYEIKDRKERKRLAEKRRLLEKAKMKGRKSRKSSKKNQGNGSNNKGGNNAGAHDPTRERGGSVDDASNAAVDGEEYYDDEYDDDGLDGTAAAAAAAPPPPPPPPNSRTDKAGRFINGHADALHGQATAAAPPPPPPPPPPGTPAAGAA